MAGALRLLAAPIVGAILLGTAGLSPVAAAGSGGADARASSSGAADPAADPLRSVCEHGVALALEGSVVRAESVFVSLLSQSPGDARALANLGNLHLMRGEIDVAIAFYDRAARKDTADAGIVLNRGTALMLSGDENAARAEMARGVALAGGTEAAATLLGIPSREVAAESSKGAEKTYVSKDEVRALLLAATGRVPADSAKVDASTGGEGPGAAVATRGAETGGAGQASALAGSDTSKKGQAAKKRSTTWRSAGPRGAADSDAAAVLYWKL